MSDQPILPAASHICAAIASLINHLPSTGLGIEKVTEHIAHDLGPGLNASSSSANYYGFVTGGVTPAAKIADNMVTQWDQNVQVHLPDQSIATIVEDRALTMLLELLNFEPDQWKGRTFTTGATASNVLGLACGREHVLMTALKDGSGLGDVSDSVGELGILELCRYAGVERIQVLSTMPHSSISKAASIVGLGRSSVTDVGQDDRPLAFDMDQLEHLMSRGKCATIVVVSCGEINTGGFATNTLDELLTLRRLCDRYGAWLHVDGAFGIFARVLHTSEFEKVTNGAKHLELADSITGDAHKLLNVPYDCGFFFCRDPNLTQRIFRNPNALYLTTPSVEPDVIPSPLNIGIENSRRFRALPVYATLMAYGRVGYTSLLEKQIQLARAVAKYIFHHDMLLILPERLQALEDSLQEVYIVVLFRAKDKALNEQLVQRINKSGKMYVSGTTWAEQPASRVAVSNWQVDVARDSAVVRSVLDNVLQEWQAERARKSLPI